MNCLPNQDFKSNESLVNVAGITQLKGFQQWQDKAHQNFAKLHKTSTEIHKRRILQFVIKEHQKSKLMKLEMSNLKKWNKSGFWGFSSCQNWRKCNAKIVTNIKRLKSKYLSSREPHVVGLFGILTFGLVGPELLLS